MDTLVKPHRSLSTGICLLILLACCCAGFWPLSFQLYSLKNDALNYFLPVRYQVSEAISNGYLPLWSPYFNLGYPLHGDMQAGVWNPVVQLFSLFGPYTVQMLEYETLLYVYISGAGMFFLTRYFFNDHRVCLLVATAFMLCGYNSDSAQFLNWISSSSFLPFVFLFYYRTLREGNWRQAVYCGFFLYLFFTTAYPADFILTAYLMVIVLICHFFSKDTRNEKNVKVQIRNHFILGVIFVLLSLPAIISYAEFLPLTQRGNGATYRQAMSNYFHPSLLFSYFTPLPVWRATFASATDPLERNSYFGLVTCMLFIASFFIRSDQRIFRFFKWGFIISLLFSFGEYGGLRVIAYHLLPLMNTFRHPANAKLFSIFFACLLAAFALHKTLTENGSVYKLKTAWVIMLCAFAVLILWAFTGGVSFPYFQAGTKGFKAMLDSFRFHQLLFLNVLLQVPFLILIYFFLVKKQRVTALVAVGILNCVLLTALVQPFTVVKKDSVAAMQNILDTLQKPGYPKPGLTASIRENSAAGMDLFKEIGASNMYNKKIGRVDYRITPSNLHIQNEFWFNPALRERLLNFPLFYRADTLIHTKDTSRIPAGKNFAVTDFLQAYKTTSANPPSINLEKFSPQEWNFMIKSNAPGYYTLFQSYYPRWQLYIDGKKHNAIRTNVSFTGMYVPAGDHKVVLRYKRNDITIAFFVSLATFLIIMIVAIYNTIRRSRNAPHADAGLL